MQVNIVEKKAFMSLRELVKFQILTHCYIEKVSLNDSELDCLALLSMEHPIEINEFCKKVVTDGIFKSTQTARNCLVKLDDLKLLEKEGKNKKILHLSKSLLVYHQGNIVFNVKFGHVAST